ncbi:MAG: hypothetical protein KJ893_04480 [Candidatus Omnitrophica bacterium]|nr:hypothetical protein [Candidatus Omnitrophota bacterium]MBU4477635.1 hypothetical protein [Candidatus Omnitrophota bacterium]
MRKGFLTRKAFSLIETLIVSVLFIFIMLVLLTILSSSRMSWQISQAQTDLYQSAQKAMIEMAGELTEVSSGFADTFIFVDPLNGEYVQGVWFASSRGDSLVAGEDGSADNYYMHLAVNNLADWRSLVLYCAYETSEGTKQLRRYVDYGSSIDYYAGANIFPLTFISATATQLNFLEANGVTVITINRTGGRVLANDIATEDTNNNNLLDAGENDGTASAPMDNSDGFLDYGVNFTKNVGTIRIILFLCKEVSGAKQAGLILSTVLRTTVKFRQP